MVVSCVKEKVDEKVDQSIEDKVETIIEDKAEHNIESKADERTDNPVVKLLGQLIEGVEVEDGKVTLEEGI